MAHSEHCSKCKYIFLKTLKEKFGEVTEQWNSGWPCRVEDVLHLPELKKATARSLEKIYKALQSDRGYLNFVRRRQLPACDYYINSLNCLVEFDESQHFTARRALTLSLYPNGAKLGFDKGVWHKRCVDINRHDNDPMDRDEKRAWYDTLRDVLPVAFGMNPTIRVFAKDTIWCNDKEINNAVNNIIERSGLMGNVLKKKSSTSIDFSKITKNHVKRAIREIEIEIDKDGIPPNRGAKSTEVIYKGKRFPAKYVLGKAYQLATKTLISPDDYSGGDATARVLYKLGFEVLKNDKPWEEIKIYRVFLKGTYDTRKGEYNNWDGEKEKDHYAFNKWVIRSHDNERIKAVFDELDGFHNCIKKPIIVFPACALFFKGDKDKDAWRSYLKKKSEKYTIIMGILNKNYKNEYIAIWNNGKYLELNPGNPQQKIPNADGWVYISTNIGNHLGCNDPGKYCFDLGHGAFVGHHWKTLEKVSREKNISIILTSWYKSIPNSSWIYKDGEEVEYELWGTHIKTEYDDIIDKLKGSFVKSLFK